MHELLHCLKQIQEVQVWRGRDVRDDLKTKFVSVWCSTLQYYQILYRLYQQHMHTYTVPMLGEFSIVIPK